MTASFGSFIGLIFGIGFLIFTRSAMAIAFQQSIVVSTFNKFAFDKDFAYKVVAALISGSLSALITGLWTQKALITVFALITGSVIGLKVAESNIKNRAIDYDLRIRMGSGAFVDVVILCMNSGLPLRKSILESAKRSSREITEIWWPLAADELADTPFTKHLADISTNNRTNVMGRIARTLLISQERGTPISQTLQNLSTEIRSETRRQLLEIAAKKDVAMMVPVVFGILPSITAIALYPAFISLSIM